MVRGVTEPRSAAAVGADFPYTAKTVCIIEVGNDGSVRQGGGPAAYRRAAAGESRLYAVWPGEWRSDLFLIDDLDEYAKALGIVHDAGRTGLADHVHDVRWAVNPYEKNPSGLYITVDVWFDCGCAIRDLRAFAEAMRAQRGWEVATTGGWGGSDGRHYVRVRRKSIEGT
jgi:hypothetical protein